MLDVHILMMDYTPSHYHDQCRKSIEVAIENAGFEVKAHFIPGVLGHLGEARYRGYSLGNHPYVTHVDDDDYLAPDAFAVLKQLLESGCNAITTGETLVVNDVPVDQRPFNRHHLAVYRRELVKAEPYRHFRFFPDQFLMRQIKAHHLAHCGYFLRISDDSGSRRQRRAAPEEVERERVLLNRPDLVRMEYLTPAQIQKMQDDWLSEEP